MDASMSSIHNAQAKLSLLRWDYWRSEVFLTWQWWFLIVSLLILVVIWLKILEQENLKSILLFGIISLAIVMFLDVLGAELQLWMYPKMGLPWGARCILIDVMIAIYFMLVYQYGESWQKFIVLSVLIALIFTFIFEPIAIEFQIYKPLIWKPIYSFPIYVLLLIVVRLVVDKINKIEKNSQGQANF